MCDPAEVISDVFEDVFDVIGDVGDWVAEDIIEPVGRTVTDVLEKAADDPLKTIAQIAAVSTGNAWALPLIEGASVAADGGDITDVLEATAKAYVMQEVGSYVGNAAGAAAGETAAGIQYGTSGAQAAQLAAQEAGMLTSSGVAGQIVGSGAAAASVAVVSGQDPLKAFATGGIGAATSAILGKVDAATGGNFVKLPPTAKAAIQAAVTAQLTGNPNPSAAVINSIISASGVVTDALKSFDPDGTKLDNTQRTILTDVLMGTATAAITGGASSNVISAALSKAGSKALGDMATGVFKTATSEVTQSYEWADGKANQMDLNIAAQKDAAEAYNSTASAVQAKIDEQTRLRDAYNNAVAAHNENPSASTAAAANAAITSYNTFVTAFNKEYAEVFQPALVAQGGVLDNLKQDYAVLTEDYEKAIQAFATNTDKLSGVLDPIYRTSDRAFVEAMNPEFNAAEYKKINGLAVDADPYTHFLEKGQYAGLPTNAEQADRLGVKAPPEATITKTTTAVAADKIFDGRDYSTTAAARQAAARMGMTYFTDSSGNTYKILTQDEVKSQIKSSATFGEAFSAARKSFPGKNFEWTNPETGKTGTFTTQTKQEAAASANAGSLVKVDQKVIDYTVDKILPNITDYKNFNPASLTKTEYAQSIGSYLNATDAQRQLMLKGADRETYGVIAEVLKSAPDMIKQAASAPTTPIMSSGTISPSDYTNYTGVIKAAGETVASDVAGLAVTGLIGLNKTFGYDTATLKEIEKLLVDGKDTAMSKLVGDEKVAAGALASFVESYGAFRLGGAALSLTSLGAITANNAWVEGATAVIDERGYAYKDAEEARKNGVFTFRALTTTENAQRTAMLTVAEITGEALGIPGMSKLMKAGLPIGGNAAAALKTYVFSTANEVVAENITTAMQMAVDKFSTFGLGQNATWGDLRQALADTTLSSIIVVGSTHSAATITNRLQTAAQVEAQRRDDMANVTPIKYDTVVARTKTGEDVTFAELLTSQQIANLSDESTAKEFADLIPVIAPNTYVSFDGVDRVAMGDLFTNSRAVADTSFLSDSSVAEVMRQQGFRPSDETVSQFVGLPATPATLANINTYVDRNTLDLAEVKSEATKIGITLTDEEANSYVRQGDETTLASGLPTQIAITRAVNAALQGVQLSGGATKADVASAIAEYAAAHPGMSLADIAEKVTEVTSGLATTDSVRAGISSVLTEIGNVSTSLTDKIAANEAAGMSRDAATQKAITDLATELGATRADVLTQIGATEATLTARVDALTTAVQTQIANVEKSLTDKIAANEAAGMSRDAATQKAITDVAAELGTTRADVLTKIGATEATLNTRIDALTTAVQTQIANVEKSLTDKIAANEAAGMSRSAATQKAITDLAAELGTTRADVLTQIGATEATLNARVDALTTAVQTQIAGVESSLTSMIAANEAAGMSRDAATQKAITDLAAELGTTRADVLTRIGATEATLNARVDALTTAVQTQIRSIETNILVKMAKYEAAGLTRDQALAKAIDEVSSNLGNTKAELLTRLGKTELELQSSITALATELKTRFDTLTAEQKALATQLTEQGIDLNTAINTVTQNVQDLQTVVGRGTQQATKSDLDAIINLLEQNGAYNPQYDYNGDKVIDQKDKIAIETYLKTQEPGYTPGAGDDPFEYTPAEGTKWAPTGIFKTVADEAEATRQAQAAEAERTRQANAAAAIKTQRMGNLNNMMNMLGQAGDVGGQQVTVKQADPAKIGYIYDWNSIFANPSQEKMFASPFAKGGMVDSSDEVNDELLKLLKG